MSQFLGQCGASLSEADLQLLIGRFAPDPEQVSFRGGCFHVALKLPMGFGVHFVAIPQAARDLVRLFIPLDQIRGDRTRGLIGMIAGGLWGMVSGKIEKEIGRTLAQHGLPAEAVSVEQTKDSAGNKVGCVDVHLPVINQWLAQRPGAAGLSLGIDVVWATESSLNAIFNVYQTEPLRLAPPPTPRL